MTSTREYINTESTRVVEQYLELLDIYQKKFREHLTVFMQIGDFYEIYGIEYPDGRRVGNVWEISDNLTIRFSKKNTSVYGNKDINVQMAGVPVTSMDRYLNTAVEDYGWTVVVIEQEKEENKIERYISAVINPGTNYVLNRI